MATLKCSKPKRNSIGISVPHPNDILCGRGGASNNHPGNAVYRTIIEKNKLPYMSAPRQKRSEYAVAIVNAVSAQDPPGRFIERNKQDRLWYEIDREKAIYKTAQSLRENNHNAREIPIEDIPEAFCHLLNGKVNDGVQLSGIGTKRKEPEDFSADVEKTSDDASTSRAQPNGLERETKKVRLDPRFFFKGRENSKLRRVSCVPGSEMSDKPYCPTNWTKRFSLPWLENDAEEEEEDSIEPIDVLTQTLEPNAPNCVITPSSSGLVLSNFLSSFGIDSAAQVDHELVSEPSATNIETKALEEKGELKVPKTIHTAAVAEAKSNNESPPQPITTLTSDELLPSFLDLGAMAVMEGIGEEPAQVSEDDEAKSIGTAPSLGTTTMSWDSCDSRSSFSSRSSDSSVNSMVSHSSFSSEGNFVPLDKHMGSILEDIYIGELSESCLLKCSDADAGESFEDNWDDSSSQDRKVSHGPGDKKS